MVIVTAALAQPRQPRVREVFDPLQAEFFAAADMFDRADVSSIAWDDLTRDCAAAARHAAEALLPEFVADG